MEKTLVQQNPQWSGKPFKGLADRRVMRNLLAKQELSHVQILTGVRRCGKSTVFKLLMNDLLASGVSPKSILNINLDAPVFIAFWDNAQQLSTIVEMAERLTGEKVQYLFLELERLEDALARGAKIYGEIAGYAYNSDATSFVLPNPERQAECIQKALDRAGMEPKDIHLISTHATSTPSGDSSEMAAICRIFADCPDTYVNNTKSFIGHTMGAAGSLELAGNLNSFDDLTIHPTINVDELDPACAYPGLVINEPKKVNKIDTILNNSFGMVGINAVLIIKRYKEEA